ncbi:YhzD-like protein [Oceanobacillus limi]|uniref:YhzD-like protein n=1 Tax=Oceanobacillus limi TaxID=930131 RepID=A0A1H9YJR7_9BACI|nr:YhzD family protein [Oceanobacillus limi]SES69313.1 YhzD-like protein [Oceanobacillus limi]
MTRTYVLTVFDKSGGKLMDESFTAANDQEAKEVGTAKLSESGYNEHTHRCVSPEAKLVLFHR